MPTIAASKLQNPVDHALLISGERRRCLSIFDNPSIDAVGGNMTVFLKKLTAADAEAYQRLRLEGLLNHPCEFGAAFEEEANLPLEAVGKNLEQGLIYGAFLKGRLLAVAGYRRFDGQKKQHKGQLFGVYVGKDGRGQGLGESVVRHVIEKAKMDVEQLIATVASLNLPAKSLYKKLGFVAYGHEPRAHKVGDRYFDQDHMVIMLA